MVPERREEQSVQDEWGKSDKVFKQPLRTSVKVGQFDIYLIRHAVLAEHIYDCQVHQNATNDLSWHTWAQEFYLA